MARNGSGTYNRAVSPYTAGTTITAATVNSEMDDIATALTGSMARDGQSPATANIPMGGFRLTGLGNAVANTDAAALGQITAAQAGAVAKAGDTMTGALGVIAGTISAPGLFVSGDTNTGLFQPSADTLAVTIGGVEMARFDANGIQSTSLVGMVSFFAGNAAPLGWLKANGQLVSRTTYAALWTFAQASGALVTDAAWLAGATGSFSQGDGSTTFRLPDYRGEFLRGWDDGRGVDSGRTFGSTQSHALQNHSHTVDSYINGALGASGRPQEGTAGSTDSFSTLTSGTTGNSASETRPLNIALLACIKF